MKQPDLYSLYVDISKPGSLSGRRRFYKLVKQHYPTTTQKQVDDFLTSVDAYTLHAPKQKIKKHRRVMVTRLDYQYALDLVDMSKYSRQNSGMRWILNIIGVYNV